MKLAVSMAVLSIAVFSSACAVRSQSPAAKPAVAQPVAAQPAAAQPAAAPDAVAANPGTVTDAQIKQMRARGYTTAVRNGTTVFCKNSTEVGSRFPVSRCNTIDELNVAAQSGKEFTQSFQQQASSTPPSK
jgi:hypothetical protein